MFVAAVVTLLLLALMAKNTAISGKRNGLIAALYRAHETHALHDIPGYVVSTSIPLGSEGPKPVDALLLRQPRD